MRINTILSALLFLIICSQGSNAASVVVQAEIGGNCNDSTNPIVHPTNAQVALNCNFVPTSGGGSHVSSVGATASVGSLGVSIAIGLSSPETQTSNLIWAQSHSARAFFTDRLTVIGGPENGFIRVNFGLGGPMSTAASVGTGTPVVPTAFGFVKVNSVTVQSTSLSGDDMETSRDPFAGIIGYLNSVATLSVDLEAGASCSLSTFPADQTCTISVALGNTLNVLSAVVLDENMNPVPDATLVSDSGFDYETGVIPIPFD